MPVLYMCSAQFSMSTRRVRGWWMLCSLLQELPDSYGAVKTEYPWKHLYLQQNLQELVGKLNDNPDFPVSGLVTSCVPCLHLCMLSCE